MLRMTIDHRGVTHGFTWIEVWFSLRFPVLNITLSVVDLVVDGATLIETGVLGTT